MLPPMPIVRIPTPLRRVTDGRARVVVGGDDVRTVVSQLEESHPGIAERLLDGEGELRRFVNLFVADEDVRHLDGLDTAVAADDVVSIIPAVAGGCRGPSGQ